MLTKCYTMLYLREVLLWNKNSLRNLFLCFHTESTMMYDLFYDFILIPFMISLVLWLHSDYDFSMSVCFVVLKLPISNNQKLLCSYCLWKMPVVQCHCLIVSLWLQFWFHFVFLILKSHSKTINWIVVRSKWDPLSKILCSISQLYPLRYDILAKFAKGVLLCFRSSIPGTHPGLDRNYSAVCGAMYPPKDNSKLQEFLEPKNYHEHTYHERFNMFVRFHHWIGKRTKPYSSLKDENWLLGVQDPSRWNIMTHMSPMPGNILPHPSPYPSCTGMTWRFNSAVSHP